jgi:hypothetical protein
MFGLKTYVTFFPEVEQKLNRKIYQKENSISEVKLKTNEMCKTVSKVQSFVIFGLY